MLGFDSNLIPNLNILVFQPYPGEDSEYLEESGRFAHAFQHLLLGISRIFGKFILTGLISYRIQQGSLQILEYLDYSLDSERIPRIIRKITRRSSEMAKSAIPAQEISENSEKLTVFLCADTGN